MSLIIACRVLDKFFLKFVIYMLSVRFFHDSDTIVTFSGIYNTFYRNRNLKLAEIRPSQVALELLRCARLHGKLPICIIRETSGYKAENMAN